MIVIKGLQPETDVQTSANLIPRATVESLVARRNVALEKCDRAYARLDAANAAILEAQRAITEAAPDRISGYTFQSNRERQHLLEEIDTGEADIFKARCRRLVDIAVRGHIIEMTELETVMDHEEKDALRRDLQDDPPEITVENIHATLSRFVHDADTIWKRGLANCFSKLDRRFRSHTGWKIGSRIILERMFNESGHWSYYCNKADTLHDVERAFLILDGRQPLAHWYGIVEKLRQARDYEYRPHQTYIETEFFRVYVYKNGNCHIWFQRDDLVEKANKTLAEHYGEVLADGEAHEQEDLFAPKTAPARYFGHFPTPAAVADKVIDAAAICCPEGEDPMTVLEPSAGAVVDCVEIQDHLAGQLLASGLYRNVWEQDFIARIPTPTYDRVVMNPPFDSERDIDHVLHALEFLKPDGLLVAIMSAGTEWRETKKSRAFRDRMASLNAKWHDLPTGSFSEVGTNVNTVILRVWKGGRQQCYWW